MLLCGMEMGSGWGGGYGINHTSFALLLIALGIGAMVKYKALKATSCQTGGKVIAYFIMIAAALGIVCSVVFSYTSRGCHEIKRGYHENNEEMHPYHEGMQLPPGHPNISDMKAPRQAPAPAPAKK